jgi:hypothetical protein
VRLTDILFSRVPPRPARGIRRPNADIVHAITIEISNTSQRMSSKVPLINSNNPNPFLAPHYRRQIHSRTKHPRVPKHNVGFSSVMVSTGRSDKDVVKAISVHVPAAAHTLPNQGPGVNPTDREARSPIKITRQGHVREASRLAKYNIRPAAPSTRPRSTNNNVAIPVSVHIQASSNRRASKVIAPTRHFDHPDVVRRARRKPNALR